MERSPLCQNTYLNVVMLADAGKGWEWVRAEYFSELGKCPTMPLAEPPATSEQMRADAAKRLRGKYRLWYAAVYTPAHALTGWIPARYRKWM